MAAWLFNVDMLARPQAGDGHGGVPVFGSGDGDGVHVLRLKDMAKVSVRGGGIT